MTKQCCVCKNKVEVWERIKVNIREICIDCAKKIRHLLDVKEWGK